MLKALDISQYFINKGGGSITQLKLQKILYYAQGFYLAASGEPLFPDTIHAWEYGPVVVELRREFGVYGNRPIPLTNPSIELLEEHSKVNFLEKIWSRFGSYTATQLVDMTHQEPPWIEAYQGSDPMISQETMKNYFSSRLAELEICTGLSVSNYDTYSKATDFSDLEESVADIDAPREDFESKLSTEYIEFSDLVAEKIAEQVNDNPEDFLEKLAKSLVRYTD